MTQWSLTVSNETDEALKTFLAQNGGETGDLSQFVEDAVKHRLFELTVQQIKDRNSASDQQEIMDAVDEAVSYTRANRS